MKKLTFLFVFAAMAGMAGAAELKVAVIDLQKTFAEYYKTKEADVMLKERLTGLQKEMQDMKNDYQKMVEETTKLRDDAQDKTLSEQARKEKQQAFETKVQDVRNMERKLQEFQATRQKQFEDQSRRMRQGIVEEITKVVNDIGAKEKYNLILDRSGSTLNGTATLLFAQDVKDLTDDVVKLMNANKPAGGSKPAVDLPPTKKP
jgi:outer membrane protein